MATKFNIKRSLWLVLLILSFRKESRDICLWIMQTRFISDAFIFILGKTCQILFYDVPLPLDNWALRLTSWLPVFLDLFKRSQIFLKWTQTEILTKISYHICLRVLFLEQTMWICLHCVWPELLFIKSDGVPEFPGWKWKFIRDGCKLSFPRPFARAFSRGSLRLPK